MTYEKGDIYDGTFDNGVKQGRGVLHLSNGSRYDG